MKDYPLVSIITVNFRQEKETVKMLESIPCSSYPNLEVIVVDNGSLKDCTALFKRSYQNVKVIISKDNLGFAGGNNLGIQQATGKYLYFLNNDTILTPDTILPLVEEFENNPEIGVASPKIRYYHNPEYIQYAGFTPIDPYTGRNKAIGKNQPDTVNFNVKCATYSGHGAAMMVSRKAIDKVGLMNEDFFLYYEEVDWCAAIQRAGFVVVYVGTADVFHKESVTTGKISPLKTYYMTRNRILFMKRNFSKKHFKYFSKYFLFIVLPKDLFINLFSARFKNVKALVNGTFDGLKVSARISKLQL